MKMKPNVQMWKNDGKSVSHSFGCISEAWLLIKGELLDLSLPAAQEKLNAHDYWCLAFPESPTERWPDCLEQGTEMLRQPLVCSESKISGREQKWLPSFT